MESIHLGDNFVMCGTDWLIYCFKLVILSRTMQYNYVELIQYIDNYIVRRFFHIAFLCIIFQIIINQ